MMNDNIYGSSSFGSSSFGSSNHDDIWGIPLHVEQLEPDLHEGGAGAEQLEAVPAQLAAEQEAHRTTQEAFRDHFVNTLTANEEGVLDILKRVAGAQDCLHYNICPSCSIGIEIVLSRSAKPSTNWNAPSIAVLQLSADAAADVEGGLGGMVHILWKQQGKWRKFRQWTDAQTGTEFVAERLHLSPVAAKNGVIDPVYQQTTRGCQYRLRVVAQEAGAGGDEGPPESDEDCRLTVVHKVKGNFLGKKEGTRNKVAAGLSDGYPEPKRANTRQLMTANAEPVIDDSPE